jgi:ABC-type transport system involved in cytochrome c biogenesis ATPase subunit
VGGLYNRPLRATLSHRPEQLYEFVGHEAGFEQLQSCLWNVLFYEEARDVARALAKTEAFEQSRRDRKRIEMLFAHLKRILRLGRLHLRGPRGAQFEFTLAAIAQNLRRLAKLVARTTCAAERRVSSHSPC